MSLKNTRRYISAAVTSVSSWHRAIIMSSVSRASRAPAQGTVLVYPRSSSVSLPSLRAPADVLLQIVVNVAARRDLMLVKADQLQSEHSRFVVWAVSDRKQPLSVDFLTVVRYFATLDALMNAARDSLLASDAALCLAVRQAASSLHDSLRLKESCQVQRAMESTRPLSVVDELIEREMQSNPTRRIFGPSSLPIELAKPFVRLDIKSGILTSDLLPSEIQKMCSSLGLRQVSSSSSEADVIDIKIVSQDQMPALSRESFAGGRYYFVAYPSASDYDTVSMAALESSNIDHDFFQVPSKKDKSWSMTVVGCALRNAKLNFTSRKMALSTVSRVGTSEEAIDREIDALIVRVRELVSKE